MCLEWFIPALAAWDDKVSPDYTLWSIFHFALTKPHMHS